MRVIDSISNKELIEKYGFKVVGNKNKYPYGSLEKRDDDEYGLGLSVWHYNRSVQIILGQHAEYGCCDVPKTLVRMIQDNILEEESDKDE